MILLLLTPLITGLICFLIKNARLTGYVSLAGSILLAIFSVSHILTAISSPLYIAGGMFYMDALSAYIMAMVIFLGFAAAMYSISYLEHELEIGLTTVIDIRRYYALFHVFVFTMIFITVANNLALMWIAIEATTIVSAILIGLGYKKRPLAIEAAWKYIILCTVGITFALLGTFITYYASTGATGSVGTLDWSDLRQAAHKLNPATMKLAFIFILVGYGTKAGLAPVHNWLPDAYTQAPSPISALLSGILSNTAFYGIMRFTAIVEPSTGSLFTGNLLIVFGVVSIGLASVFVLVQSNYKRLIAYSSIEHMGIISLGMGIGGFAGVYGALLHILNHAIAKPLIFFTSGRIQAHYGSTKIENVNGVLTAMPLLGTLTFIAALSLTGTPPFNIFISEFMVLKAVVDKGLWVIAGLFLLFAAIAFYGILAGFSKMLFNKKHSGVDDEPRTAAIKTKNTLPEILSNAVMVVMVILILILGVNVPDFIDAVLKNCVIALGVK